MNVSKPVVRFRYLCADLSARRLYFPALPAQPKGSAFHHPVTFTSQVFETSHCGEDGKSVAHAIVHESALEASDDGVPDPSDGSIPPVPEVVGPNPFGGNPFEAKTADALFVSSRLSSSGPW